MATKFHSSRECLHRLKKYISDYAKDIDLQLISREMIDSAIKRARLRNNSGPDGWPKAIGTTVYKLVERIL